MPDPISPSKDYRFGNTTGVDLTAPLTLNPNPLDIESINGKDKVYTWEKWETFLIFIKNKIDKNDVSLNSKEKWEALTLSLINEFNTNKDTSNWVKFGGSNPNRGIANPLTREDIFAVQRFNRKTDPNVQVDGWLGTQTLRMSYPRTFYYKNTVLSNGKPSNQPPDTLIAITWGNKRFVTTYKDDLEANTSQKSRLTYWKLFDPKIHNINKFDRNPNFIKEWVVLGQTVEVNQSAERINSETVTESLNKKILQTQTKIKSVL
jgi:hypothetical protein